MHGRLCATSVPQCYTLTTVDLLCTAWYIARVYWACGGTKAAFDGCCHRLSMCVGLQTHTLCTTRLPPKQGRWPNLERWFAAMEARPAYAGFKSDHYTHVHDLPPQLGGCVGGEPGWLALPLQIGCAMGCAVWCMAAGWRGVQATQPTRSLHSSSSAHPSLHNACCKLRRQPAGPSPYFHVSARLPTSPTVPEAKPFADAIDGRDGKSWRLPLEPLSATSLEAHTPGEQPEIDRLQVWAGAGRAGLRSSCSDRAWGCLGGRRWPLERCLLRNDSQNLPIAMQALHCA